VDASGIARTPSGASFTFKDARDFLQQTAESADIRRCYAKQWARFALDRAEGTDDTRWMAQAYERFASGRFNVRDLLTAMATSDAFRYRQPLPGEK